MFALTSQSNKLIRHKVAIASTRLFALSGSNNKLVHKYKCRSVSRAFIITGQVIALSDHDMLSTISTKFRFAGQRVNLVKHNPRLNCLTAVFDITVSDAGLHPGKPDLIAVSEPFNLLGTANRFISIYKLPVNNSSIVVTGSNTILIKYVPKVNKFSPILDALPTNELRIVLSEKITTVVLE